MKKVLMIAHDFPPMVTVGAVRPVKFAKYLPQFGWKPSILTVKHPGPLSYKIDHQFMRGELKDVKVHRSWGFPLAWATKGLRLLGIDSKWLFVPDSLYGWLLHSVFVGRRIIKKERIDAIYATSPPTTAFLIAAFLKRICDKPLVVDFRDLWINNPFVSYPSEVHYNLEKKMEEWVLRNADAVTVTCESQRNKLMETFPFLKQSRVSVIYNGYDSEDFENMIPHKFDKFTILHAGSIYGSRIRAFRLFLEAADYLVKNSYVSVDDFQLVFLGYLARQARKTLNELNLSNVRYLGVKPYKEALQLSMGADVLLIIPGAGEVLPGKIFEYLATGNLILNLGNPEDEVSKLIAKVGSGKTVKIDFSSIKEALHEILKHRGSGVQADSDKISEFSRFNSTKSLARILDSLHASHSRKA